MFYIAPKKKIILPISTDSSLSIYLSVASRNKTRFSFGIKLGSKLLYAQIEFISKIESFALETTTTKIIE